MSTYNNLSDIQLTELLKASDRIAFTEIYNRYHKLVLIEAYKKLRNLDQAKDIVQDLFTTLWLKRENVPIVSNLAGYLITAVKNSILNFFEHQHVQSKYIASLADYVNTGNIAHTDYLVREKEWEKYICAAIESLPIKMKAVFNLSRKSNLTHKEIARKLSLSERTVNAQILNAILRLKAKFGSFLLFLSGLYLLK